MKVSLICSMLLFSLFAHSHPGNKVDKVEVTTLSTMLADWGDNHATTNKGEWGYSALVEVEKGFVNKKILFDTGHLENLVEENVKNMDIDLSGIEDVVLSHHHNDHIGGFERLFYRAKSLDPNSFKRVYVAKGFLNTKSGQKFQERFNYLQGGHRVQGKIIEVDKPTEIAQGVWITGPISRNIEAGDDSVPDDQALVINSQEGLVVLTGCAHAGAMNTLKAAMKVFNVKKVYAALGGWHLFEENERSTPYLQKLGKFMNQYGVEYFLGSHCTAIEPVHFLRKHVPHVFVDSVGTQYIDGKIVPLYMNKKVKRHKHESAGS